jgi:beta-1,4-mannosyltransferase
VSINPITQAPDGDAMLIPHGHYRESFAPHPKPNPVEGRIVFAGLIRPYKGIEGLIASFSHTATPGLTLRIVGKPTDELRTMIEVEAAADPRLSVRFGYLPDEEFVAELSSAELVCLPYTNVHNSGTLLAALSLNRPVLVKDSATTRILVEEVGPGWVHLFTGQLASADIDRAVAAVRTVTQRPAPRLDDRDWVCVARRYGNAFIEAMRRAAER